MEQTAAALYQWLQRHNIDPDSISLVLRAKNGETNYCLQMAIKQDLSQSTMDPSFYVSELRDFKMNGIAISLRTQEQQ